MNIFLLRRCVIGHIKTAKVQSCCERLRQSTKLIIKPLSPHPPPGKLGGQDSFESIESFESCERLTQSWSSQSSFSSLQRVPSYDSFDSEDYPTALHGHKPKGTFKDYVRERSDLSKDKPVIPAAALAGYTGMRSLMSQFQKSNFWVAKSAFNYSAFLASENIFGWSLQL